MHGSLTLRPTDKNGETFSLIWSRRAASDDGCHRHPPEALIADKAYDAHPLINRWEREITPVIPPKCTRKTKRDCDFALFCERNLIERFSTKKAGEPLADEARSVRELFSP